MNLSAHGRLAEKLDHVPEGLDVGVSKKLKRHGHRVGLCDQRKSSGTADFPFVAVTGSETPGGHRAEDGVLVVGS